MSEIQGWRDFASEMFRSFGDVARPVTMEINDPNASPVFNENTGGYETQSVSITGLGIFVTISRQRFERFFGNRDFIPDNSKFMIFQSNILAQEVPPLTEIELEDSFGFQKKYQIIESKLDGANTGAFHMFHLKEIFNE